MDHLAIMTKKWGLIEKILKSDKTIESRWYKFRRDPWNKIKTGDVIYFKDSGETVTAKARVDRVWQFEGLDEDKIREILREYGGRIGFDWYRIEEYVEFYRGKKYCILMDLKEPEMVPPFGIDKTGYGAGTAWISVDSIDKIKIL